MDANEEMVRAAWKEVHPSNMFIFVGSYVEGQAVTSWAAAAEFTRERLEQIEISRWCVSVLENHLAELDGDSRKAAYIAILDRERAELAKLTAGMKAGA